MCGGLSVSVRKRGELGNGLPHLPSANKDKGERGDRKKEAKLTRVTPPCTDRCFLPDLTGLSTVWSHGT